MASTEKEGRLRLLIRSSQGSDCYGGGYGSRGYMKEVGIERYVVV